MIFQNHSFSFSLYCIFSQGKMCILEDLQQELGFMEEETEWTGLYWSLILQQENHIVDNLTAIRPYGDRSYSNLKFSCVQFCGSPHYNFLLEVFHFLWASKWVLKSCKIITKQITNIFVIHERKMYLESRMTHDIQNFFFPKKWAGISGGKM